MKVDKEQEEKKSITWITILYTVGSRIIPFLTVESCSSLDLSMTNHEARQYLEKSYKDMRYPAFDEYVYTDKKGFGALRWVMKRGIDLRDFKLELTTCWILGHRIPWEESEKVLDKLMEEGNTDIAEYYATRDKLCQVDEKVDRWGYTALNVAAFQGNLTIAKGLLNAGVDTMKVSNGHGISHV